ncbi:hypothetical protein MMC07_009486 [Pseudocyphellaria aurata]|nr:hypothetical protein [Pseudocyphellaria aurata]
MPYKNSFDRISNSLHLNNPFQPIKHRSMPYKNSFDRISNSLHRSRGSSTPSNRITSAVSTARDPSRESLMTKANPQLFLRVMDIPPGPSTTVTNCLEVSSASSQGMTTPSEDPETVALTLESPPEHLAKEEKLSWDVRAAAVIFGLNFFGCKVRSTHSVLRSYGFQCSVRSVILCAQQYNKVVTYPDPDPAHSSTRPPGNGSVVCKRLVHSPSGVESVFSIDYVDGKSTVLRYSCALLRAREPLYRQLLATKDGSRIVVDLAEGRLEIRALDALDPELNSDSDA